MDSVMASVCEFNRAEFEAADCDGVMVMPGSLSSGFKSVRLSWIDFFNSREFSNSLVYWLYDLSNSGAQSMVRLFRCVSKNRCISMLSK